jgi:hypothetical protein
VVELAWTALLRHCAKIQSPCVLQTHLVCFKVASSFRNSHRVPCSHGHQYDTSVSFGSNLVNGQVRSDSFPPFHTHRLTPPRPLKIARRPLETPPAKTLGISNVDHRNVINMLHPSSPSSSHNTTFLKPRDCAMHFTFVLNCARNFILHASYQDILLENVLQPSSIAPAPSAPSISALLPASTSSFLHTACKNLIAKPLLLVYTFQKA